jgi:hypothetical protein
MPPDDPELLFERVLERRLQSGMAPENCPDAGILAAFHEGTLSGNETSACKMHVATCARCGSVIEALDASDAIPSTGQEYIRAAEATKPETSGYDAGRREPIRHIVWTRRQPFKEWLTPATIAVAAGVILLIGILVIRQIEKGAIQIAMNQPPIEKHEERLSPGDTRRLATDMPSQPKAQPKTERESALIEKSIKSRLRPDTLDSDTPQHIAPKNEGEEESPTAGLGKRSQREEINKEIAASAAPKPPTPVIARTDDDSKDIVGKKIEDKYAQLAPPLSDFADKSEEWKEDQRKAVREQAAVEKSKGNEMPEPHDAWKDSKPSLIVRDKQSPPKEALKPAAPESALKQILITSPDPNVQWRFGAGGLIEKSSDGGKSWKRQSSNAADDLLAGVAPAEKVCWLAGKNGTVLLTTDGEHWAKLPFPSQIDLGGISSKDARQALLWDTQNKVKFFTNDGGKTWTETTGTTPKD